MLDRSSFTVLIVDDAPEDRLVYQRYLNRDGLCTYTVWEADSVNQAISLCAQNRPDLILLDYWLPDDDGLAFLAAWQAQYGGTPAPVVMLTGQGNEKIAVEAMKQGAQDYLLKGNLTAHELCQTVHTVLEQCHLKQQLYYQQEQQRLVSSVALRIRQSLKLQDVLQTTVDEVCQLLQCDRTLIYQFAPDLSGVVTNEAVRPQWLSSLQEHIIDSCFQTNGTQKYEQGWVWAVSDIQQVELAPCHRALLERFQVKANLVVPILLEERNSHHADSGTATQKKLWGLLAAHQCDRPRQWQKSEIELLEQLAIQLAIAIQQAALYQDLQTLNAELESKVQARTEELADSERRFRGIFNNTFQFTGLLTPEGTLLEANQTALDFGGIQREDVINRPLWETYWWTISPETQAKLRQAIQLAALGEFIRYEVDVLGKGGTVTTLDFSLRPIWNDAGEVTLLIPEGRDIGDRKQNEATLLVQAQMLDQIHDAVVATDPAGTIENWNLGAERLYGYSSREAIGQPVSLLYFPEDWPLIASNVLKPLLAKGSHEVELRNRTKSGSEIYINLRLSVVRNQQGNIIRLIGCSNDISDRKAVERELLSLNQELETRVEQRTAELQESQRFIQSVADNTPNLLYIYDLETNQNIYANREIAIALGYSVEDIQEMGAEFLPKVMHPNDLIKAKSHFQNLRNLAEQERRFFEYRLRGATGEWRWYRSCDAAFHWSYDGQVQQIIGIAQDITEQKQMEKKLQLQAQILDQIHDSVIATDLNGIITNWNEGAERTLGYLAEEAVGQHISLIYPQHMYQVLEEEIIQPLQTRGEHEVEVQVQCKSGTIIDVLLSLSLLRDMDQNPIGMIGFSMDITERKRAELVLRQSEEFKQRLLESSSDCIKVLDLHGQLIYVNEGGICLLEIDNVQCLLNTQWISFWPPKEQKQAKQAIKTAKAGNLRRFQGFCPTAKGTPKWWDVAVTPIFDNAGQVCQLLVISRDITEQKQAEAQLQQVNERLTLTNAELYRATRLKDEFLANMSHELRTPLNTILGLSEGLQDGFFGTLNDRQQSSIGSIERSGQHLLALINDILDLAKVESGKLELQLSPVSISYLCSSSLTFIRQQATTKNIQLTTQIPTDLPDIVVDELRIRQVLINLLNNAVKFTPDGGSVKLIIQQEVLQEVRSLNFLIQDTGTGIHQDDISKLFQPFTQVDSKLNRKHNGTGLGLSLVRRLVELHGGTVSVTSELGKGSCFTVHLPYNRSTQQNLPSTTDASMSVQSSPNGLSQQSKQDQASSHSPISPDSSEIAINSGNTLILIAEDNEANVISISSYLEGRGYRWLRAHNGHEAIILTMAHQPNLILMDIQMPEMDGLEAIHRIRIHPDLCHIPIIAVSALAMPQDRQRCLDAGANSHVSKPVKLKQLIAEIEKLLAAAVIPSQKGNG